MDFLLPIFLLIALIWGVVIFTKRKRLNTSASTRGPAKYAMPTNKNITTTKE